MTISRRFIVMIATFVVLSLVLELICFWLAPSLESLIIPHYYDSSLYALFSSYMPAAAAVITALVFHKDIRAFGWGVGKGRYYLFALALWLLIFILEPDLLLLALGLNGPGTIPSRPDFLAFIAIQF